MSIEAMKEAIDDIAAAKRCEINSMSSRAHMLLLMEKAIDTLSHAIEQAEKQEPVAWVDVKDSYEGPYEFYGINRMEVGKHHLYTVPPPQCEWVELTDEDMSAAWAQSKGDFLFRLIPFARAIESKLREKNT